MPHLILVRLQGQQKVFTHDFSTLDSILYLVYFKVQGYLQFQHQSVSKSRSLPDGALFGHLSHIFKIHPFVYYSSDCTLLRLSISKMKLLLFQKYKNIGIQFLKESLIEMLKLLQDQVYPCASLPVFVRYLQNRLEILMDKHHLGMAEHFKSIENKLKLL